METFLKDLKHSVRMFRQSKAFTATAVAGLALGIGANTAIFSIVNTVLLKPVPFPDPDRLVMFMNTSPGGQGPAASPAKFQHWKQQPTTQDAAAFRTGVVNFTGGEFPEQLRSAQVSAGYFRLFGAPILRGRIFNAEEDLPNGPKVAVISYSLWTRRFANDPQIVGKTISLSGEPHVVIGIVGPNFDVREFGPSPEVWVPFQLDPNTSDQGHYFQAAGIGIYGLMAYSVQQRTQEIGIRLALGGEASQIKNMVVFQGMSLAIVGVVLGISFAFDLTRFITRFLYGVQPWDPTVFVGVPVLLSVVALLAVWIPARRASRINPIDALRYE